MGKHELAEPASGINPIRTLDDWRDLLHRTVTAVCLVLGTSHVAGFDTNGLIVVVVVPAILGVIDAAVSYANATDTGRRLVYAVLGGAQAILAGVGFAVESLPMMIVGVATAVVNSVYASQWTATSPTATRAVGV